MNATILTRRTIARIARRAGLDEIQSSLAQLACDDDGPETGLKIVEKFRRKKCRRWLKARRLQKSHL